MHIFQGMGITACKGDFEAYKLELISLGANQEKKGHIYIGTVRRDEYKKRKEDGKLSLRNSKNVCLVLTSTSKS